VVAAEGTEDLVEALGAWLAGLVDLAVEKVSKKGPDWWPQRQKESEEAAEEVEK
jgi:hypothetical protein